MHVFILSNTHLCSSFSSRLRLAYICFYFFVVPPPPKNKFVHMMTMTERQKLFRRGQVEDRDQDRRRSHPGLHHQLSEPRPPDLVRLQGHRLQQVRHLESVHIGRNGEIKVLLCFQSWPERPSRQSTLHLLWISGHIRLYYAKTFKCHCSLLSN